MSSNIVIVCVEPLYVAKEINYVVGKQYVVTDILQSLYFGGHIIVEIDWVDYFYYQDLLKTFDFNKELDSLIKLQTLLI